jgi:hypothetical protein
VGLLRTLPRCQVNLLKDLGDRLFSSHSPQKSTLLLDWMENEIFLAEIVLRVLSELPLDRDNDKKTMCFIINSNCYDSFRAVITSMVTKSTRNSQWRIESIEPNERDNSLFSLRFLLSFSQKNPSLTFLGQNDLTGIHDIQQISILIIELNLGFSFLEAYLSLYSLIPQILPQTAPMGYGKIVFQLAPTDERSSNQPLCLANTKVWTSPGMLSSIEYLISLIRLSHHHPSIFLALAPKIRQKVLLRLSRSLNCHLYHRLNIFKDKKINNIIFPHKLY